MPTAFRSLSFRRPSTRAGFTRRELLAFIGILAILAGVAVGPIDNALKKRKVDRAMENVRTINMLLSQYATDNNDTFPVGLGTSAVGTSEGIARNLLKDSYAQDAAIFALGSTTTYHGTAPDFSDFSTGNISWDFTGGATRATGITASAPDLLPTIYCTGETVTYPTTAGTGLHLTLSGNGPFAKSGLAVAYKNNSVRFIRGTVVGNTNQALDFISTSFSDTATYTQIKP